MLFFQKNKEVRDALGWELYFPKLNKGAPED